MKKLVLLSLAFMPFMALAQIQNRDWVMFGVERVNARYSGVSNYVADDRYKLQNTMTWRMEFVSKHDIIHFDLSWLTLKLVNILDKYNQSTFTEQRLLGVQNRNSFRGGKLYLLGDKEKAGRWALGWQADWRYMGLSPLSGPGGDGYHVGALERKDRLGLGMNGGYVQQLGNWGYTRAILNVDFSPMKLKSVSVYPEWLFLAHFGNIGLYSLLTYRADYLWGNLHPNQAIQPVTDHSLHTAWRWEIGVAIDAGFHGK